MCRKFSTASWRCLLSTQCPECNRHSSWCPAIPFMSSIATMSFVSLPSVTLVTLKWTVPTSFIFEVSVYSFSCCELLHGYQHTGVTLYSLCYITAQQKVSPGMQLDSRTWPLNSHPMSTFVADITHSLHTHLNIRSVPNRLDTGKLQTPSFPASTQIVQDGYSTVGGEYT